MKKLLVVVVLAAFAATVLAVEPRTIYVDQSVATSGDGTTWAKAFKTIQEGVNAASKEVVDTVLVTNGVYDSGSVVYTKTQYVRVKIDRKVILKSVEGKEKTHVVGCIGDGLGNADADGNEPIAGIGVTSAGAGTIVEGFTIRDCGTWASLGQVGGSGVGAIASSSSGASNHVYVAHCTIRNCHAQRASAMRGGTAISTLFVDNDSFPVDVSGTMKVGSGAVMDLYAYNCIFARNGATNRGGAQTCKEFVNCTFVNNPGERGVTSALAYNTASFHNGKPGDNVAGSVYSCVFDGTTSDISKKTTIDDTVSVGSETHNNDSSVHALLCMGACRDDYRPVNGGFLYGKDGHYGKIQYTNNQFIPPEYKQRDFYGNKLADDAVIPIGVILPPATPVTEPVRFASTDITVDGGRPCTAGQIVSSDRLFEQIRIASAAENGMPTFGLGKDWEGTSKTYYHPLPDGTYLYTLRKLGDALPSAIDTLSHASVDEILYVDRENGSDDYDGSAPDKAFQSLDKVAKSVVSGKRYLVCVAEGVYDNEYGSATPWTGNYTESRARFLLSKNCGIRFVATGARDRTVIEGAYHSDDERVGPDALRCVVIAANDARVVFSGFTFRKGTVTGKDDDSDCRRGMGGGVLCRAECALTIQDSTLTDNCGSTVAAGYFTTFLRCRFYDNCVKTVSDVGVLSVTGRGAMSACVFEANPSATSLSSPTSERKVTNLTLYMPEQADGQAYSTNVKLYNSIIWTKAACVDSTKNTGLVVNTVLWGMDDSKIYLPTDPEKGCSFRKANPRFSDPVNGDYRPNYNSPAYSWRGPFDNDMAKVAMGDYDGNPLDIDENGMVVLGAVHSMGSKTGPSGILLLFR